MVMKELVVTVCDACDRERGQEVDAEVISVGGLTFELCSKCRSIVDQFDAFARKYAHRAAKGRQVKRQAATKPKPKPDPVVWVRRAECLVPGCGAVVHWRAKGLHASNMHGKKAADVQWRDFQSAEDPK